MKLLQNKRFGHFASSTAMLLAACSGGFGQTSSSQDPLADPGFQHFYNLEYDDAIRIFGSRTAASPNDAAAHTAVAQAVLYYEMFLNHALDSDLIGSTNPFVSRPSLRVRPSHQQLFQTSIGRAVDICQKRIEANSKDRTSIYILGVAYGLRANWNFLVNKEYISALRDATQARKLHNQASELDPSFVDARFVQAAHDYVIASLPLTFKFLGFLAGFHGDREGGLRTLRLVAETGHANRVDAAVLLSAILRREKRPGEAVQLLADVSDQFPRNYLFRFELVRMYSDSGDKTNAIANLDRIELLRVKNSFGFGAIPAQKVAYSKGNIYFWYGDLDLAQEQLKKAISANGDWSPNDAAIALLRLGQTLDLKGEHKDARSAYTQVVQLLPQSETAKDARNYILFPYKRKKQS